MSIQAGIFFSLCGLSGAISEQDYLVNVLRGAHWVSPQLRDLYGIQNRSQEDCLAELLANARLKWAEYEHWRAEREADAAGDSWEWCESWMWA